MMGVRPRNLEFQFKGVPAWESHTGTQLVSPAKGLKKIN